MNAFMPEDQNSSLSRPSEIQVDYVKSPLFRDIFVDGIIGGLTPRGYIQMAVYNERFAIPQSIFLSLNKDGTPSEEVLEKRVTRSYAVRDLEANLVLDAESARSMAEWLLDRANLLDAMNRSSDNATTDPESEAN